MKKHICFFTIIILAIGYSSCNQNENRLTFEKFPRTEKISFDTIAIPPILTYIEDLSCNSNYLVTLNSKREKNFQVFKLPEIKFIGEFGLKGNGPGEFSRIINFDSFKENFYVLDNLTIKMLSIDDKLHLINEKKLPGKLRVINEFALLNDSTYIGTSTNHSIKKEMFLFSEKTEKVTNFSEFPVKKDVPNNLSIKFMVFLKRISINNNLNKLAVLYTKYPLLRIYNSNSLELGKEIEFASGIHQNITIINDGLETDNTYMFYKEIFSSDKFIYGLYLGKTPLQINSDYANMTTYLHVWDWNGNPVAEYNLSIPIFKFVIINDNTLIGVVPEDEKHFYTYKLTHLITK